MDIAKKIYQELGVKERAVASYAAINRSDQSEIDRLTAHASKDPNNRKTAFALNQALNIYNLFMSEAIKDFLVAAVRSQEASSFCKGWLAAGGETESLEYQKNALIADALTMESGKMACEVEVVRLAALAWCKENDIPSSFFSGPLCVQPLVENDKSFKEFDLRDFGDSMEVLNLAFNLVRLA